eukprot:2688804-Amphidinium_carterae.1
MHVDEVIKDWVLDYASEMAQLKNWSLARSFKEARSFCPVWMSTHQGVGFSCLRKHKPEQAALLVLQVWRHGTPTCAALSTC